MDQEYLEDKVVTLKKLTGYQRLREVFGLAMLIVAIYLVIALGSFDRADPSWTQTAWHDPVHNAGGRFGAWIADVLFSVFGVVAYLLPLMLFIYSWNVFKQRYASVTLDYFTLSLRIIGFLALILSSCSLADLNFDDWHNFTSGGVLGRLISDAVIPLLDRLGATLVLLFMWLIGFTLFTGWSWLTIAEKVGSIVTAATAFILNKLRSKNEPDEDDEESEELFDAEQGDILLSSDSEAGFDDENYVPENQLAFNLEVPDDESHSQPSITFVPQYPPIETEPTIVPLQPVAKKSDVDDAAQEPSDRISQLINSMANKQNVGNHGQPEQAQHEDISFEKETTPAASPVIKKPVFTPARTKIIPDLPRPNPVRIPTRRELMSYGIHIPSQTYANNNDLSNKLMPGQPPQAAPDFDEQLQEDVLRRQFAEQQKQRYGAEYSLDENESGYSEQYAATHYTNESADDNDQPPASANVDSIVYSGLNKPDSVGVTENSHYNLSSAAKMNEPKKQILAYEYKDSFNPVPKTTSTVQKDDLSLDKIDREKAVFDARKSDDINLNDHSNEASEQEQALKPFESQVKPQGQMGEQVFQPQLYKTSELKKVDLPESELINMNEPDGDPVKSEPEDKDDQSTALLEGLIHPFLMRNDKPLHKPTTPLPTLDLLTTPPELVEPVDYAELEQVARLIEARLADYRVKANVVGILPGPVITLYELDLAPGVKAARISNLSRDIARSLSTVAVRVVEVIPGRPYVGLELPNKHRQTVYVREVLDCAKFREISSPLAIVLGKDISGQPVVADLAKMPHVLVAGTTGSGKSVGVNAMIISMLYKATPDDVRFIMIDPKMLELSVYEGIPHLLTEVVTDMKDAANALRWCVGEMERRYKLMSALGVRNLAGYNERIQQAIDMGRPVPDPFWKPTDSMDMNCPMLEKLPYIVVIVDEFADLMMAVGKKVEELIARLAQKARAAGIHLVLATQRPSVDVITGLIKANIPTRIAFTVSSKIDSRTILDQGGAESLLGMGDMLYMAPNSSTPVRVHGAFVRDEEVHAVVQDWKARGKPQYIDSITKTTEESENGFSLDGGDEDLDPLFDQAVAFVVEKRKPSISGVQRQFRIGYNRAARIIEQMEAQGIVSPPGNNGNREVLAPPPHD